VNKTKWYTMGKVGTGYSVQDLQELNDKIKHHCKPYVRPASSNGHKGTLWPQFLHPWNMKVDDVPDVFIAPNHSVIMEIKCAELVTTDQFSARKTPRFPRCVNIRYDKGWYEAMTQKELTELRREPLTEDAQGGQARRLAKKKKPVRNVVAVVEGMGVVKKEDALSDDQPNSLLFQDLTFSIIPWGTEARTIPAVEGLRMPWSRRRINGSASQFVSQSQSVSQLTQGDLVGLPPEETARIAAMREHRKQKLTVSDLQKLLYQHGAKGVVGAAMTEGVDFVVTLDPTGMRTQNIIGDLKKKQAETCDVVLAAWVFDSIVAHSRQHLHFEYLVHASTATKDNLQHVCDRYGDRFAEGADRKSLIRTFKQVDKLHTDLPWANYVQMPPSSSRKRPRNWRESASELSLEDRAAVETQFTLFWRSVVIYVDCHDNLGEVEPSVTQNLCRTPLACSPLAAARHSLMLHSAHTVDQLHYKVTHVLVHPAHPERFDLIKQRLRQLRVHPNSLYSGVRVVTPKWVEACISEGVMRPPENPEELVTL